MMASLYSSRHHLSSTSQTYRRFPPKTLHPLHRVRDHAGENDVFEDLHMDALRGVPVYRLFHSPSLRQ
jgi:hypothetical protein